MPDPRYSLAAIVNHFAQRGGWSQGVVQRDEVDPGIDKCRRYVGGVIFVRRLPVTTMYVDQAADPLRPLMAGIHRGAAPGSP